MKPLMLFGEYAPVFRNGSNDIFKRKKYPGFSCDYEIVGFPWLY